MISRKDFVFTIGYEGSTAVVDGTLKRRYGSLTTEQLAEKKLYKQAVSSAVYEAFSAGQEPESAGALQRVLELYNRDAPKKIGSPEELKRTFGVQEIPSGIGRVTVI